MENVVFMLSLDKRKQLDWKKIQSEHEGGDSGWGGSRNPSLPDHSIRAEGVDHG